MHMERGRRRTLAHLLQRDVYPVRWNAGREWYEILHSYFNNGDFNHALIQFIADNELRIKLNKGKYPPFVGHENLFPLMKKILPHWKRYLKEKQPRDINKLRAKKLGLKEFAAGVKIQ